MSIFHWHPFIPFSSLLEMARKKTDFLPSDWKFNTLTSEGPNTSPRKKKAKQEEKHNMQRWLFAARAILLSYSKFYWRFCALVWLRNPTILLWLFSGRHFFVRNNRDYLMSAPLKVGAPLFLTPMRVHVGNCSNRGQKMQAGCQKYGVPWPFAFARENGVKLRYQTFLLYAKM